jgi:hypothetical protein
VQEVNAILPKIVNKITSTRIIFLRIVLQQPGFHGDPVDVFGYFASISTRNLEHSTHEHCVFRWLDGHMHKKTNSNFKKTFFPDISSKSPVFGKTLKKYVLHLERKFC